MHSTSTYFSTRFGCSVAIAAGSALVALVSCVAPPRTMSSLPCAAEIHADAAAAVAKLTAAASTGASPKVTQLCLAYAFIAQKKYPAAVEAASRAIAIDKSDALAFRMRAFARYRMGAYPQAIEDANASLKSETTGEAYEILGKCRLRTGDAAGAAQDFRIWANLDKSVEARCWMGSALWTTGDTAGALDTWLAAELSAPSDPEPFVWKCGFLYRAGDKDGALLAAKRAVQLAPDSPQTLGTLARVQTWSGDSVAAAATLAQLAKTNPTAAAKLTEQLKTSVPTAKGT
ncbi:MAG: tetratricopeptide repeat protein [Phycisphaerales bacterium]|nr:tetratricopeptide repeat protein [Phycisphaerales bacterium]